tara:strand:- start:132 stop:818 length:687 start_codon:yes stop_codon:yes gene_type:complete
MSCGYNKSTKRCRQGETNQPEKCEMGTSGRCRLKKTSVKKSRVQLPKKAQKTKPVRKSSDSAKVLEYCLQYHRLQSEIDQLKIQETTLEKEITSLEESYKMMLQKHQADFDISNKTEVDIDFLAAVVADIEKLKGSKLDPLKSKLIDVVSQIKQRKQDSGEVLTQCGAEYKEYNDILRLVKNFKSESEKDYQLHRRLDSRIRQLSQNNAKKTELQSLLNNARKDARKR